MVEEISRGGVGIVYRATDTRLNRDVALKVLPAELTSDRERNERFVHEARAASALEHPNIAVIHDIGEADGISFIAMELVRGDKLSAALAHAAAQQSGPPPSSPSATATPAARMNATSMPSGRSS